MGKGTNTTTTQSQPPQQFLDAYTALLQRGNTVADQPLQQYGGPMVAGFTPDQTAGFEQVQNASGIASPYINTAAQYASQGASPIYPQLQQFSPQGVQQYTDPYYQALGQTADPYYQALGNANNSYGSSVQQYLNPYTQNVINTTLANSNIQDQLQQNQLLGRAISSGVNPFGGDRAGLAQAELARNQDLARNQTIAGLESAGYTQAADQYNKQQQLALGLSGQQQQVALNVANQGLGQFNTQQQIQLAAQSGDAARAAQAASQFGGLGAEAQSTGLAGANALLQTGGLQQQLGQQQLNVPYQQFQQQQAYPFQTTQYLAGLTTGLGSQAGGTSTTTAPAPTLLQQIAGVGATGLGAYGAFGGFKSKDGGRVGYADGGGVPFGGIPNAGMSFIPQMDIAHGRGIPPAPPPVPQQSGPDMVKMAGMLARIGRGSNQPFSEPLSLMAPQGGLGALSSGSFGPGQAMMGPSGFYSRGGGVGYPTGGRVPPVSFLPGPSGIQIPQINPGAFAYQGPQNQNYNAVNALPQIPLSQMPPPIVTPNIGAPGMMANNPTATPATLGHPPLTPAGGLGSAAIPGASIPGSNPAFAGMGLFGGMSPQVLQQAIKFLSPGGAGASPMGLMSGAGAQQAIQSLKPAGSLVGALPWTASGQSNGGRIAYADGGDVEDDGELEPDLAATEALAMASGAPPALAGLAAAQGAGSRPQSAGSGPQTAAGRAMNSPWLALMAAGLGTLASRSPFALQAIGEGGQAGLAALQQQQKLDAKPIVDHSGATVRIYYPSTKEWIDTGVPTTAAQAQQAAEQGRKDTLALQEKKLAQEEKLHGMMTPYQAAQIKLATDKGDAPISVNGNLVSPTGEVIYQGASGLAQPAVTAAAERYIKTGTFPPNMGKGVQGRADMTAVQNEVSRLAAERGIDAAELPKQWQNFKAEQTAITRFGSGPQGNTIRSLGVVVEHLDTFKQLGEALKNGNIRLFNDISQRWAQATGAPEPTNFDMTKKIVGTEIIKALGVAGAGTEKERAELGDTISRASSPAQISEIVDKSVKPLLLGQLKGLKQQFKSSTGLPESRFNEMLLPSAVQFFEGKKAPLSRTELEAEARRRGLIP